MYGKIAVIFLICALVRAVYIPKDISVYPDECPPNEEYLICGPACPANCTSWDQQGEGCITVCAEGCFCNPGLVRSDNGTCVAPDQCDVPPTCPQNEEFLTCGSSCPATCNEPEPRPCVQECKMGCYCVTGFVRDEASKKCVPVENCPADQCLNQDEVYDICNAACEPTCSDPEPICNKICIGGCICDVGLLRDGNGTCVTIDKCDNSNDVAMLNKYINAINKILHLNESIIAQNN